MYNKSHLVRFGNFLLKTYGVQVHSTDGKNQPVYQREVTDADMANWNEEEPNTFALPSHHQIGDPVVVYFGTSGVINNCKVIKAHFTESKVLYDVEVKWRHAEYADKISAGVDKEGELTDRLYNLDSAVVLSPDDFEGMPEDQASELNCAKEQVKVAKLALKEIYSGTDFPLSIAQNALQILNQHE